MKRILLLIVILISLLTISGCNKKEPLNSNIDNTSKEKISSIVLYFSVTNNTKRIANLISEETNSDLIEIIPKEKYTDKDINYNDNDSRANKEQNNPNIRPKIENKLDLSQYDTIYLGYPIWWGTVPKIIYTLLDNYDLTSKKIVLFCTSGSTGIETSVNDLKKYNNKLNIIDSKRFSANTSSKEIKEWIEEQNLPKGEKSMMTNQIKVLIDNKEYNLTLEDNETAKSFIKLLPKEFNMRELNGNEKYIYLDNPLPTNEYNPKKINVGDVMLYGVNCLVIFYKTFNTDFSYTKIGHIDNLDDLGSGSITVKIEK